jgi:hypothetical protein
LGCHRLLQSRSHAWLRAGLAQLQMAGCS